MWAIRVADVLIVARPVFIQYVQVTHRRTEKQKDGFRFTIGWLAGTVTLLVNSHMVSATLLLLVGP